ncbi:hypothetical protein SADUNF_Sadunf01G0023900 [Salix dunnii]|uniref:Uncharacterized protein n=1 Tax=Salix dunnii TaxID=1413687 RepID=A0A835N9C1_9ROSI|nr:hypothetical protein SADUNF_Sadunf01G0023900 [Salix dunnii]
MLDSYLATNCRELKHPVFFHRTLLHNQARVIVAMSPSSWNSHPFSFCTSTDSSLPHKTYFEVRSSGSSLAFQPHVNPEMSLLYVNPEMNMR